MSKPGDVETMMEFRSEHWGLWEEFVKDNEDYRDKCSNHVEYCNCSEVSEWPHGKRIVESLKSGHKKLIINKS